MQNLNENFWSSRYLTGTTGWDIGSPSPPLYQYLCQIDTKTLAVLVPGAGNAYEIAAAWNLGFKNIHLLDISLFPIKNFLDINPSFPTGQTHHQDFFEHQGRYDLILEQTFFCALDPELRPLYAKKMHELLKPGGRLVGVLFDKEFDKTGPPFGGKKEEYRGYFEPYFTFEKFEPCYNSIPERMGTELFINFKKSES
ncbi:MAG: SAM-dependent methyltransferase [Algoriphagus sp.]|uniref:SAM-dependent methyltransferase n=1 Tax=Algoriphagus sp. TaxID=1872435 RepID=UPI0027176E83|nr:SAM-dependent methyltransferase [Algoriphagus sp.]MDO8967056.1 SAM-dependent methyltransferase [Algoriphagus sp.]MDP2043257.1 SAM-dependent methyltransferase [Algoriphagus sp.]MDP3199450.1 SAM-dependent methyltransferase [Algoriphagus sp.]MDP3474266.1 SAM-dependent methyltransferase [Algoriphagus sp.]